MKRENILKNVIMIVLSVILVMSISNVVLAEDDPNEFSTLIKNTTNSNSNTANTTNNTNTANTNSSFVNLSVDNTANKNNTSKNNSSVYNASNKLANAGWEDNGALIAVIVVVCGVSAVYSYKKISQYRNL